MDALKALERKLDAVIALHAPRPGTTAAQTDISSDPIVQVFHHAGSDPRQLMRDVYAARDAAFAKLGGPLRETSRMINAGLDVEFTWTLKA